MRILAIINGEYGSRHIENIQKHSPSEWQIKVWKAHTAYPPVIDYPEDYLPSTLPDSDLILSFAEHRGVAELLPDIVELTNATAVIAPVDNESWLPRGLARQLRGWLERMDVACATPKPLCSLTEEDYGITRRERKEYTNPLISEFAHYFGQPDLELIVDPEKRNIVSAAVKRDAVCGCARYVAEGLIGADADEASEKAGLLHHHYPCLASMGIDPDFADTLLHVSGNVLKDNVNEQIKSIIQTRYIRPGNLSEE